MRSTNRTLGAEALCIVSPDPEPSLLEAGQQVKLITTNVGLSYGAAAWRLESELITSAAEHGLAWL